MLDAAPSSFYDWVDDAFILYGRIRSAIMLSVNIVCDPTYKTTFSRRFTRKIGLTNLKNEADRKPKGNNLKILNLAY